jgi:hypothetical protein
VPETEALKAVPEYFKLLGQPDAKGLQDMLKENAGATPDKIAAINAKDWTYDVVALRRDIGQSITNLKPDAVAALDPLAQVLRTQQALRDSYMILSAEEQVQYLKDTTDYTVGQLFWGYQTSIPSLDIANRLDAMASQYGVPLELIPAFQQTDTGKDRMPPKPLWSDFFAYYDLRTKDGAADSSARTAFRKSHSVFDKWGQANLGWHPLTTTSPASSGSKAGSPIRPVR